MARETAMAQTSAARAASRRRQSAKRTCSRASWVRKARIASRARRARSRSGIRARLVRSDAHQILRARIDRHQLAHQRGLLAVLLSSHGGHQPADRVQHLDGRIPALGGQRARKHDMPVEQRAHRIHQRILLIVALHQHGIKRRDRAGAKLPARSTSRASRVNTEGV